MSSGYNVLPAVYDRWQKSYGRDFSELILPRLIATLRRHKISGTTLVDVACGTGTLALFMARRGWSVSGIDASEGMITIAREKFRGAGLPGSFLVQDMRNFRLASPVALATSFFDGLNHVLEPDGLRSAFQAVKAALLPGGWFVFDMNNELCFTQLWTKTDTIQCDGFKLTLESRYDRIEKIGECVARVDGGNAGERGMEIVRERCFPPGVIRTLLEETGFVVRECEEFNFTLNPLMGKLKTWWVAEGT
jgi:SAM-dependent methyltransferase